MTVFAQTERLILREILPTDVDGLFELDSDPEVHRYLGNNPVTNKAQIVDVIAFIRQQYVDHGIGRWAVVDKSTGEFMGWAGLKFVTEPTNNRQNFHDLGYRLIRKYWGKGIATECARASLAYGFEQLGLTQIFAAAHVENLASNRILSKVGFQCAGTFLYDEDECNWYEIEKPRWRGKG